MTKSTQVVTDANAVADATPSALTKAKSHTPAVGNLDYAGMQEEVRVKTAELLLALNQLKAATDSSDPNLATIQSLIDVLV